MLFRSYIVLILFSLKKSWTMPEIRQLLESVIQPPESEPLTVSVGVGGFGTQLSDLHRSWLESGKALRYAGILDEVGVFIYDDLEDRSKVPQISINDKDSLLLNLRKVDREAVMRQLRQYMEQLRQNRVAPEILTHECLKLIYLGLSVLSEAGLTDTLPLSRKLLPHEEIARFHTFDQIANWVEQSFLTMLEQLQKTRENTSHSAVQVVRSFLEQHYMEEFSLNELAEKVGLNATYLSILFRDEVGQSYIRYLTRLRLDKARQLLEQGLKITDVCKQVGYNNYRYFCDLFRKQIGMTPGDYKNQFRH